MLESSVFWFLLPDSTPLSGARRACAYPGCFHVPSAVLAAGPCVVTGAARHHIDFGALFDSALCPHLLISRNYVLLAANRAYLAATGRVAEDVVGKHLFEAFPANASDAASANAENIVASIEIALSTGRPHTTPVLCHPVARKVPTGQVFENRYWSAVHTPVLDGSGNALFVLQNSTDVTDLYDFDAARGGVVRRDEVQPGPDLHELQPLQLREELAGILRAERNQLQFLFDQAPGFMAVLRGRECVFDTVNRAYSELVGGRGLLGRPFHDALPELAEECFEPIFAQVFDSGETVILSGQRLMIRRDPSGPLEERYVDLLYKPILAGDGQVVGIFHQGHDVTDGWVARRSLAEKLEELAAERRRSAFQLRLTDRLRPLKEPAQIFSESAALITDYFQASRVAYGEYHRQQRKLAIHSDSNNAIGAEGPVTAIPLPEDVAVLEHGGIWVCDDLARDPRTGPEAWENFEALQVHAAVVVPLTHQGPSIACLFVGTATPRTWTASELEMLKEAADRVWTAAERVRAEGALRAADERKDQFLAMLAHELRNPLAPIRAAADIQQMAPGDVERVQMTSAIIARQVRHMTSLVEDLLDVSRVTGGLVALGNAEVDVSDVLSAALEQVKPVFDARSHEVTAHHSGDVAIVCGDEKRLVQIFANVLNNAAKYTPDGGRIRMGTEVLPDTVVVRIDDTGIGMSADVVATAFDLFAQAERTPDRAQGGLGIGLALVKRLVELHDGSVTASSAGTNAGSQFVITLPRLRNRQTAARCLAPEAKSEIPLRILVVDDNHDAAATLAMLVEASGHTAFVARNARDGLRRAMDERPQVCLLDVGLPGMDGNELAVELKRHPDTANAVLIAVTGYGQDEDRRRTADAGFAHHLVKPVDAAQLLSLLAKAGEALSSEC